MSRKKERDREKIIDKIWDEIKKLNWAEINKQTQRYFKVAIIGEPSFHAEVKDWLATLKYDLANEKSFAINETLKEMSENTLDSLIFVNTNKISDQKNTIKKVDLCICEQSIRSKIIALNSDTYSSKNLYNNNFIYKILKNNEELSFALAYNFPVFRIPRSKESIQLTAIQNTSWAIVTASPNIVPGGHQVVTGPVEAIADFAILTTNEIKLLFELVGLNGRRVNPLKCKTELSILFSLAKTAEIVATNTTGKIPAGTGIILKGAIAYAFTMAIGDAILLYLTTDKKVSKQFFEERIRMYKEEGKRIAREIFQKYKNKNA